MPTKTKAGTLVLLVCLVAALLAGCNTGGDGAQGSSGLPDAVSKGSSLVDIPPLTAEDNPYKDMYGEWDHWIVANQVAEEEEIDYTCMDEDVIILHGKLDQDGWLLPNVELEHLIEESASEGESLDFVRNLKFDVFAQGQMDMQVWDELRNEICKMKAEYFTAIPISLDKSHL